MTFTKTKMDWLLDKAKAISSSAATAAHERQASLIKPPGSLGRLEELAVQLAGLQNRSAPKIENPAITIYAADHGVVAEGVSAFPQEVTVQMLLNFANGGAAISVLTRELNADFQVINLGTAHDIPANNNIREISIAKGTKNFCIEAAMSPAQLEQAFNAGKLVINEYKDKAIDIFIGGEMGIGNTTSATALSCSQLSRPASELAGRGTGIDDKALENKICVIEKAVELHKNSIKTPIECLRYLGGFEIAALSASYIRCAQLGIPVLVDGFICSSAALMAIAINQSIKPWLIFSHQSAEQGHQLLLESMQVSPILNLDLRLGEGSGAAASLPLLKLACSLHNNMATFSEAQITTETS